MLFPSPHAVLRHCSTEITVTDLGSSLRVSLPPCTFAETGFGATVFGASKVFTLSTFGAVNVSPAADLALTPAKLAPTSTGRLGSTFVNANHSLPAASRAAMASTRGRVIWP